jgi:hypothetical protein
MTSRQRLLAAMRFDKVDRIPVGPNTFGSLRVDSEIAKELLHKTDPFIFPVLRGSPDAFWGEGVKCETYTEGDVVTKIRETPGGPLVERVRNTGITSACVEFPFKTVEDAEKFLAVEYVPPEINASDFMAARNEIGEEGLALYGIGDAVLFPASVLSPEDFCLWWADYPDLMLQITAVASNRINDFTNRLCKAGVDGFRIVGGEYASVQLGPKGFDALVLEQDRELVDIIHSHGSIAYYHNHGNVMDFLTRFCQIGMDFLDPLEAPPWGDCDLKKAREICGNRVAFVGNLDDMEILDKLSAEEVEAIAIERVKAAGDLGFVLGGTASATFGERGARNFIALAELSARLAG